MARWKSSGPTLTGSACPVSAVSTRSSYRAAASSASYGSASVRTDRGALAHAVNNTSMIAPTLRKLMRAPSTDVEGAGIGPGRKVAIALLLVLSQGRQHVEILERRR